MTPEDKVKKLIDRFVLLYSPYCTGKTLIDKCKQSAIICVDEIMSSRLQNIRTEYWQEVKKEIYKC